MKKGLKLTLLGGVAFLFFLIATAPAGLLAYAVQRTTPLQLSGVSGTVWQGSAQQLTSPYLKLGPLTWRLQAWRLFLGELKLALQFPETATGLRGYTALGITPWGRVSIYSTELTADADWVFVQAVIPISAGGYFQLRIDSAELRQNEIPRISAQLDWHNAKILYPRVYDLGAYRFTLQPEPGTNPEYLLGNLNDVNSPLKIDGSVKIEQNGDYRFNARIHTSANAGEDLKRSLLFIGDPAADGSVTFKRQGNIFQG